MQNALNTHPSQGYVQKTDTRENTKAVAVAALKNISGADRLIAEAFNENYVKEYFPPKKHVNLKMHQGFGYGHR